MEKARKDRLKIKGPDGKLYTPEEWEAKQEMDASTQVDLDALSVEELEDLIAGLEGGGQKSPKKGR
jgi:hypothetical protein